MGKRLPIGSSRARVASSGACSETARWSFSPVAVSASMPGTMPTVETVICRQPSAPSALSARRRTAVRTASRLSIGSPMPMKTRVCSLRPTAFASRRSARNCSTISPAVRLRSKPVFVVAQKSHPIAQPTCEERQPAARSARKSGISTDSTVRPSPRRSSNLVVPSAATCRAASVAALVGKLVCNRFTKPCGSPCAEELMISRPS